MDKTAYCPYYVKQTDQSVTCTGVVPGASSRLRFASIRKKGSWYTKVCCSERYGSLCPAAAMMNAILGEEAPGPEACARLMERREREILSEKWKKSRKPVYLRHMRRRGKKAAK